MTPAKERQALVKTIRAHLRTLPQHVRERRTAQLLEKAVEMLADDRTDEWEAYWAELMRDFAGVTDSDVDPARLHTWDWLERYRPWPAAEERVER